MDFITDLLFSKLDGRVYNAILVVVDRFTKKLILIPITKKYTAPQLIEILYREVFFEFKPPNGIVTDRGSVFTSSF